MRICILFALFLPFMAYAGLPVPEIIHYQGRLVDGTNLVNGQVSLQFNVYLDDVNPTVIYSDSNTVTVVDGLYSTYIGDDYAGGATESLSTALWNSTEPYLEIVVNGQALTPRERITSVPYALMARGLRLTTNGSVQLNSDKNGIGGPDSTVSGGSGNRASELYATVSGGASNFASGVGATIGGGSKNLVQDDFSIIGGGQENYINAPNSVVGGGYDNSIDRFSEEGVISGGRNNILIQSPGSFIGGGFENRIDHYFSFLGGGFSNNVASAYSVMAGGFQNFISTNATSSVIAGGVRNSILPLGQYGTIGGGFQNKIYGTAGTVPGGYQNRAGEHSFAAGHYAYATNQGSFVWADNSVSASFSTTADRQFMVRATGGVGINTAPEYDVHVKAAGPELMLESYGGNIFFRMKKPDEAGENYIALGTSGQMAFKVAGIDVMEITTNAAVRLKTNSGPGEPTAFGEYYRDNSIVAWARVTAAGILDGNFGIESVSKLAVGAYEITLDNSAASTISLIPVANAEIDGQPSGLSSIRIVSIDQTSGTDTFSVWINNGNGTPVDNDFTFIVTGR